MGPDINGALLALPAIFDSIGKVVEVKSVLSAALEAVAEHGKVLDQQQGAISQINSTLQQHAAIHAELGTRVGAHGDSLQAALSSQAQSAEAVAAKLAEAEASYSAKSSELESRISESLVQLKDQVRELKAAQERAKTEGGPAFMSHFNTTKKEVEILRGHFQEAGKQLNSVRETIPPLQERIAVIEQEQVLQRVAALEDVILSDIKTELAALREDLAALPVGVLGSTHLSTPQASPPPSAPSSDLPIQQAAAAIEAKVERAITPQHAQPAAGSDALGSPTQASLPSGPSASTTPPARSKESSPGRPGSEEKNKANLARLRGAPGKLRGAKGKGEFAPSSAEVMAAVLAEGNNRWIAKEDLEKTFTSVEGKVEGMLADVEKRLSDRMDTAQERLDGRLSAVGHRQEALNQQLQARMDAKAASVLEHVTGQLAGLQSVMEESQQAVRTEMESISEARKGEADLLHEEQVALAKEIKRIEAQFSACTTNCLACGASPRPQEAGRMLLGNDGNQYGAALGRNDVGAPVQPFLSRDWEWESARTPLRKGGGFTTSTAHFYDGTRAEVHSRSAQSIGLQIVQDGRKRSP